MRCRECGAPLRIHLMTPGELGWRSRLFCDHCQRAGESAPQCSECGTDLNEFESTGLLGCAHCHEQLARWIEPRVERYLGGIGGGAGNPPRLDSLARARSEEMLEALAAADAPGTSSRIVYAPGAKAPEETAPAVETRCGGAVRLRIARNLQGLAYWPRLGAAEQDILSQRLLAPGAAVHQWLSALLAATPGEAPAVLSRSTMVVGDEDHLRIALEYAPGATWSDLEKSLRFHLALFEGLDGLYLWQWHSERGFLCACPALCGSGIRLSLRIAIDALQGSGEWPAWRERLLAAGCELRGEGGEGRPLLDQVELSWRRSSDAESRLDQALRLMLLARRLQSANLSSRTRLDRVITDTETGPRQDEQAGKRS